ncbi:PREDICTED: uncharacterized protein LOC108562186 [Nicrophorus vespilloides]|uniref:Uncharacterized protein LOC108562186 n=1 Tax=Nicrophorus vespilloides TaxID=110193 RepID=A0ABM1MMY1_NICVS|nr:PREDICTED: uncharacterized protein LOC108562186 [Nicrophorus vespilloides]
MLVTASNELKIHQWPDGSQEEPYSLGITSDVVCISWSKDNNFLIFLQEGGRPEILSLKDIANIKPIHIITAIDKATVAIFQRNTKRCVAIGTAAATVALYDTKTKSIGKLFTVSAPVTGLDFNVEDEYLAVACSNGMISFFNTLDENETGNFNLNSCPSVIRFHQNERNLLGAGCKDGTVAVIDIHEIVPMYMVKMHTAVVNGITFTAKQEVVISVGEDDKFCVHDIKQNVCVFRGHLSFPLTCCDVSPDGKHLVIGTNVGSILIYETKNYLSPLMNIDTHSQRVTFVRFSQKMPAQHNITSEHSIAAESSNHTEITAIAKVREENEFKSLYNKFINNSDDDTLKLLREDIVADIQKDAEQLHNQMRVHMDNLQDFIKKEFEKISTQMDEKWDLLNLISGNYKHSIEASEPPYENDCPIVLE